MAANFEQPDESAHINAITNAVDDDFIHTSKDGPPTKFKYFLACITYPIRLYRRLEWWAISKFLATIDIKRERVTLKLHEKYRDYPTLALLYYFHDLAKKTLAEEAVKADVDHINKLIENGADVHATDDVGQNLMHEVARYHTPEICFLFLKFDINIQLEDDYCVTSMHIASAFNNSQIVEILASNGALMESATFYMLQTPLHYAARHDSPSSVKKLVEMGANIEARDYRGRTPLLLAAELGRMCAGAKLLDCGAKVYAIDFTGMYGLSAMVDKCPPLALKALDTCVEKDLRNRKQYFSLQFLEPITLCNDDCAKTTFTVLEETVRAGSHDLDIIRHPMIQKLIEVKWRQFGRRGYIKELVAYVIVLINWSLLCLFNPIQLKAQKVSRVHKGIHYIEIANEILTVLFFLYQVFDESREMRTNMRRHKKFVLQRLKQLEMEFKYLELLSDEEKEYLRKEQLDVRKSKSCYSNDTWNYFDWVSIALMMVTLIVHFTIKYKFEQYGVQRGILLSITLVIVWMKMFKYCRVLETLGPFCVIIASLPKDFLKIAIVYIILYIPMVCTFYHFFSGPYSEALNTNDEFDPEKYGDLEQTCFTVFLYTLVGDYGYDTLRKITEDRKQYFSFTQILIAYWIIVSSVLLLNIFIALMSDTFARVYENATVVSQFERAAMIVSIENKMPGYWRKHHLIDIAYNYAPACAFFDDDDVPDEENNTFEEEVNEAHSTLKKILVSVKDSNEQAIMEFVRNKIQEQSDIIASVLEKIERLSEARVAYQATDSPKSDKSDAPEESQSAQESQSAPSGFASMFKRS